MFFFQNFTCKDNCRNGFIESFVLEIVELTQTLSQVPINLRYLHLQSKNLAMDAAEAL
jgi:hypothetical protein